MQRITLTAIGAFGLGSAATVSIMRWSTIEPGDWLAFAGIVLGIAGGVFSAILSAIYVENLKARTVRIKNLRRLAANVTNVKNMISTFDHVGPNTNVR